MPEFVRTHLRTLICRRLAKETPLLPGSGAAAVFPSITGTWHALSELQDGFRYTTLQPPYPERRFRSPILRLSEHELAALTRKLRGRDASKQLLRYQSADMRRSAAQVASVAIPPEERSRYLAIKQVEKDQLRGEVALLRPTDTTSERGIYLHVDRRPLCRITDDAPWPLLAILNDDSLRPNPDFTGPTPKAKEAEIATHVVAVGTQALREQLEPPQASVFPRAWLNGAHANAETKVTGSIWLPTPYPSQPRLCVHVRGALQPSLTAIHLDRGGRAGLLPVEGNLLIDVPVAEVDRALLAMASTLGMSALQPETRCAVADLILAKATALFAAHFADWDPKDASAYAWHLALMGAPVDAELETDSGRTVTASEVAALLEQGRTVWISHQLGSSLGDFPSDEPEFVLPARHPAVRVLAQLAPGSLRELGAVRDPSSSVFADSGPATQPTAITPLPRKAPQEDPLQQLRRDLASLVLTGAPVREVVGVRRGRAFSYRPRGGELRVNIDHRGLSPLLSGLHDTPSMRAAVISAAVAEVNRALGTVSDAEEQRVLVELLQSL